MQYAGLIHQLAAKAKTTVRDLDPTNDLSFLRVRTTKHEIMIAPGLYVYIRRDSLCVLKPFVSHADKDYMLICVQDPSQT